MMLKVSSLDQKCSFSMFENDFPNDFDMIFRNWKKVSNYKLKIFHVDHIAPKPFLVCHMYI